ncbi:MAG TPA: hypothetical protein VMZ51_00995 [Acidimicrobiales bacterium]|nr:hypothetical protein [Acidimicrobiales bacterium]
MTTPDSDDATSVPAGGRWLLAGAFVLIAVLAACGQADGALSKAELIKRGNAICERVDNETAGFEEEAFADGDPDPAEMQTWVRKSSPFIGTALADLSELNPPKADKDEFNAILAEGNKALKAFQKAAASEEEAAKVQVDPFISFNAKAAAYGLDKCASDEEDEVPAQEPAPGAAIVDVVAKEYAFEVPATMKTGATALIMENAGGEEHSMVVAKLKPGASAQQAFIAEPGEGIESDLGTSSTAAPGGKAVLNADLTPGTFAMACFISAPDGQPHAVKGMVAEFKVE